MKLSSTICCVEGVLGIILLLEENECPNTARACQATQDLGIEAWPAVRRGRDFTIHKLDMMIRSPSTRPRTEEGRKKERKEKKGGGIETKKGRGEKDRVILKFVALGGMVHVDGFGLDGAVAWAWPA